MTVESDVGEDGHSESQSARRVVFSLRPDRPEWEERGFTLDEYPAWAMRDFTPAQAIRWRSRVFADAAAAAAWRDAGFPPEQARSLAMQTVELVPAIAWLGPFLHEAQGFRERQTAALGSWVLSGAPMDATAMDCVRHGMSRSEWVAWGKTGDVEAVVVFAAESWEKSGLTEEERRRFRSHGIYDGVRARAWQDAFIAVGVPLRHKDIPRWDADGIGPLEAAGWMKAAYLLGGTHGRPFSYPLEWRAANLDSVDAYWHMSGPAGYGRVPPLPAGGRGPEREVAERLFAAGVTTPQRWLEFFAKFSEIQDEVVAHTIGWVEHGFRTPESASYWATRGYSPSEAQVEVRRTHGG